MSCFGGDCVVNKPLITLQQQFPAPKFRPSLESQTNVVYKIPCGDCSWCYIGETGRAFNTRKKEHLRNVKTAAKGSRIANHVWANSHAIDFDNASIIDKGVKVSLFFVLFFISQFLFCCKVGAAVFSDRINIL